MANIADSLKNLSVENGMQPHENNHQNYGQSKFVLYAQRSYKEMNSKNDYVLSVCSSEEYVGFKFGVVYTNINLGHVCTINDGIAQMSRTVLSTHTEDGGTVIGMKFSRANKNIVYHATKFGTVTAVDTRMVESYVAEFKVGTENDDVKYMISFDVNCNDTLIAGGTEHAGGDAFILFWDIRYNKSGTKMKKKKNTIAGGYWESHMDDITCVSFNPVKPDVLASGSTDGLINVYDLTEPSEDEALIHSLNTELSVDKLGWSSNDSLWCTTHTNALQLWHCEGASPYAKFERSHLAVSPDDDPDNCYIVKYHPTNVFGQPFVLAGSSTPQGEKLRCLSIANDRLEICDEIIGNNQVVRDSWVDEQNHLLLTGGEECFVNIWQLKDKVISEEEKQHYRDRPKY